MSGFIPGQRQVAPWSDHHWWGQWDTTASLPNVAGSSAQYNADIQGGDLAWVVQTGQLYVCTDPTPNAAVWQALGSGGGGPPTGPAGGDLSGTYPNPSARAMHETGGPTQLLYGVVQDGQALVRVGSAVVGVSVNQLSNLTYIPDPGPARDADTTALAIYTANEPISVWAPSGLRTIAVEDAPTSMSFTIVKTNAAGFGIALAGDGWTGTGTLFGSANAAAGSWLVRLDRPNKTIVSTPVS